MSDLNYQHQNRAECRIGDIKRMGILMLCKGKAPKQFWHYALELATKIFIVLACKKLDWTCALKKHWGEMADIFVFHFYFYQPIYYLAKSQFLTDNMIPGIWLGITESNGDKCTYYVLTCNTDKCKGKVLIRSVVKPRVYNNNLTTRTLEELTLDDLLVDNKKLLLSVVDWTIVLHQNAAARQLETPPPLSTGQWTRVPSPPPLPQYLEMSSLPKKRSRPLCNLVPQQPQNPMLTSHQMMINQ